MTTRVIPPQIAINLLEYGSKDNWPPEILAKRKELREAKRIFRLFRAKLGVYDENLRMEVMLIEAELDWLYVRFGESITPDLRSVH